MHRTNKKQLFKAEENEFIELVYSTSEGVDAKELAEVILGMRICLKECAKIAKAKNFQILVFPGYDKGLFLKFKFKGITRNKTSLIVKIITDSLETIGEFGIDKVFNLRKEVISKVANPRVLAACNNPKFLDGIQKILTPLERAESKFLLAYGNKKLRIQRSKRAKFFETIQKKEVFPEMKNGEVIELTGEITRINKEYNDIGLRTQDRILRCLLPDKNREISQFHDFIQESSVLLEGIVERKDLIETPKVKIVSIQKIDTGQQTKLFF
ncbi:hypothetical protein HOB25_03340 [bacterium]|nr:hypothetical protein [bacterium]